VFEASPDKVSTKPYLKIILKTKGLGGGDLAEIVEHKCKPCVQSPEQGRKKGKKEGRKEGTHSWFKAKQTIARV
jgi:hypothetical protein